MTLHGKLVTLQLPFFLALALLTGVSVATLTQLGARSQDILKDNYRSVIAAQRMDEAIERIDDAASLAFFGGGSGEAGELAASQIKIFEEELAAEEGNITEVGEIELAGKLRRDWEKTRELLDRLMEIRDRERAVLFYLEQLKGALAQVRADSAEILGINQDAMVRKSDRALAYSGNLKILLIAGWAVATIVALLTAWLMTRKLAQPLYALQQAVKRVGEGDLEARALTEGSDEVAMLAVDFNAMAEKLQKYRKSSLGELLRAQLAAQASIDSLPEPVIVFGTEREILSVNLRAEQILGRVDKLGDLGPDLGIVVGRILDHIFGGKGAYFSKGLEETVRVAGSGGDYYLLPNAVPLRDEDGTTTGVTLVLQDVTRFKRFDELKDDMVSTVAHEFRTPLTSIRMAIHICLEELAGPLTPRQMDMLGAAREECERLQVLVDDLLDLSRLQKGITPTNPEPISSSQLMGLAVARHRDEAETAGIILKQQIIGKDLLVLADQTRIATVFDNLIANALRYSPREKEILLRAIAKPGVVRFEVADSGPGIPKQHQERIFERMYQIPGAEQGARGLGLSIVREIVLAHGGEVGVESEPGTGSLFWFTLNEAKREEQALSG